MRREKEFMGGVEEEVMGLMKEEMVDGKGEL